MITKELSHTSPSYILSIHTFCTFRFCNFLQAMAKKTCHLILTFMILLECGETIVSSRQQPKTSIKGGATLNENSFISNLNKPFSWEDSRLQYNLHYRSTPEEDRTQDFANQLQKRTGKKKNPKDYGPILDYGPCIGCPKKEWIGLVGQELLDQLSTEYLKTQILISEKTLRNRCVFYTSRRPDDMENRDPKNKNLSKEASYWACKYGLFTLWVS
jgi:hypothetical protein